MRKQQQYAAIGFVVSKVVIPLAKRQAKRAAKDKSRAAAAGTVHAARRHPARTSIAAGALAGAVGWLLTRNQRARRDPGA